MKKNGFASAHEAEAPLTTLTRRCPGRQGARGNRRVTHVGVRSPVGETWRVHGPDQRVAIKSSRCLGFIATRISDSVQSQPKPL
jgi:hypothetical protein